MPVDTVSILDGNDFVVSDRQGDLEATPTENHGLFLDDTRFLSRWVLSVNGLRPKLLSVDDLAYFKVQFFAALATGTVYVDSHLSVVRQRAVGQGFSEDITLTNHSREPMDLEVRLEAAADFADLFEVKDKLEKKGELYRRVADHQLVLARVPARALRTADRDLCGPTGRDRRGWPRVPGAATAAHAVDHPGGGRCDPPTWRG